ncbi:RTA1 like protein-domain-containing protein [Gymnopilus junonius]|uniref:RTA1 like protein-domain-containing protein n=1 Tax=Gymnopilus junonius TaxID=109634 RepID=A0A9P5NDD8_GYMJU|nr:RTA1 like protein-domain-containing protein [Gymnopilus junonius]
MSTNDVSLAKASPYNYIPTRWIAILMLSLFGVSTFVHIVQAIKYCMYWLILTACLCGIIEVLGWSGRLWSSVSPLLLKLFQIQITCTIVAPTLLLAANFVILGEMIKFLGPAYIRISPKWYTIIFCTSISFCRLRYTSRSYLAQDIASLIIQGVGGGLAAAATDLKGANRGAHIMLAGIVFQLTVIILFSLLAMEYFIRYCYDAPISSRKASDDVTVTGQQRGVFTKKLKIMTCALAFSTMLLFIRAVYRTIELADGWHGRIISNETYFNVLDGAMVILAMYAINFVNPGLFVPPPSYPTDDKEILA